MWCKRFSVDEARCPPGPKSRCPLPPQCPPSESHQPPLDPAGSVTCPAEAGLTELPLGQGWGEVSEMEGIQVVSGQGQTGLRDKVRQASGGAPTELRPP